MALIGSGAVIIWNGIRPDTRAAFFAWHNREHMLERVSTPGFLRGRRYIAIEAEPEFLTLYEVESPSVLSGEAYLERLGAPTDWTRRVVPGFTDTARALTRIVATAGLGQGGVIATLRFDPGGGRLGRLQSMLEREAEGLVADHPALLGLHLCATDLDASAIVTAERQVRGSATDVPQAALLIEGTDAGVVRDIASGVIGPMLAGASAILGIYRHEITIGRDEIGPDR